LGQVVSKKHIGTCKKHMQKAFSYVKSTLVCFFRSWSRLLPKLWVYRPVLFEGHVLDDPGRNTESI